jgi:serpin B
LDEIKAYSDQIAQGPVRVSSALHAKIQASATQTRDFHLAGGSTVGVPTLFQQHRFRFGQRDGCTAVALPYGSGGIQFLILLPDDPQGLAALEAKLTPAMLGAFANLQERPVKLHLPKLKLEPPLMDLSSAFQRLGMSSAFDLPPGTADFNRMAPRRAQDYLYISRIYHKTFLKLDEQGTEAAAATAMVMVGSAPPRPVEPVEVNVDHPFLFAIQDTGSGTCLFLGRVTDPR